MWESRVGAVVKVLASLQCVPGSIPGQGRHMWVEFVVGSLLCSERFFSRHSGFPLSSKTNISKFQFDLEYRQALYLMPLARVIAQTLPVFDVKFTFTFAFTFVTFRIVSHGMVCLYEAPQGLYFHDVIFAQSYFLTLKEAYLCALVILLLADSFRLILGTCQP